MGFPRTWEGEVKTGEIVKICYSESTPIRQGCRRSFPMLNDLLRRTQMKKLLSISFILLMTAGALTGCNTIAGAGKDVQEGGQAVQDAAS